MSTGSHREDELRRLLDRRHTAVPPGLADRAATRGLRLLRRRRALHGAGWLLLIAAVAAFTVWAAVVQPWSVPPSTVAPPFEGL
ncbi:hypothetical protein LG634_37370 [Streptomyces bambusae]|uniref:hypothetical protein n=1 Tax=Streptomyces bambusae TaxID=1550616 RepID=UPI001CFFCB09|nr:hypothetical protein [Streptomyces bambusae]MCB5170449.1 hypothetical protein [Streptomyces bambusae]